jgi:hypothetical protein
VVPADDPVRGALLRRGFALEFATLAWNVAGIVILAIAAVAARSVASLEADDRLGITSQPQSRTKIEIEQAQGHG